MNDDTDRTVYTVAFRGDKFLMVWNPKRKGWEMPGGHIKKGETVEEGASREFLEEAGFEVRIVKVRDLGHCFVCSAELGSAISSEHEMNENLFSELPKDLSFDRSEYEDTVPWARATLIEHRPILYISPFYSEGQPRRL